MGWSSRMAISAPPFSCDQQRWGSDRSRCQLPDNRFTIGSGSSLRMLIPIVFTKRRKVRRIVFPKTLPSFACFVQRLYYHGLIHGYACLQYKNVNFSPAWIPVIRLPVCQRVTHPLAYGLLSRNSSTHTPTPTSRTVTLGMYHRGVEANLICFDRLFKH